VAKVTDVLENLTNEEFEQKFNRKKPCEDTKIILSCRAGGRSLKMQSIVQQLGYKKYNII
jgi:rhodanese-related sulfurtransferase